MSIYCFAIKTISDEAGYGKDGVSYLYSYFSIDDKGKYIGTLTEGAI